ncbi:MAG: hypothetical protein EOP82_26720 [Variovorax sp.]|nr:MAG: hypothetical protein EOP82_26720 [Variovorax sp.]
MNKATLAAIFIASMSQAAFAREDFEGTYTNGPVSIEWRVGGRAGTEFLSSLCEGKKFRPRTSPGSAKRGDDYAIKSDFKFTELQVVGTNKCLPQGTYKRAP